MELSDFRSKSFTDKVAMDMETEFCLACFAWL